jgi:hypothetical protein
LIPTVTRLQNLRLGECLSYLTQQNGPGRCRGLSVGNRKSGSALRPGHPSRNCNSRRSHLVIDYTPDTGFVGTDYLVIEEVTVDHQDKVFRISIVVK